MRVTISKTILGRSCEEQALTGNARFCEWPELIVKGKRISCPPQYGHRDLQGVPRRLGERHVFRKLWVFPLIRSLRASVQRSTSVLFSFVLSIQSHSAVCRKACRDR